MSDELDQAARSLIAGRPGDGGSATQVADRAVAAYQRLASHLARLLGETGVHMLLRRSVSIARTSFAWLPAASASGDDLFSALRHAMEQQEPDSSADAFVALLSTFVGLLKKLIGDGLVDRLLTEVWPAEFAPAAKDIP